MPPSTSPDEAAFRQQILQQFMGPELAENVWTRTSLAPNLLQRLNQPLFDRYKPLVKALPKSSIKLLEFTQQPFASSDDKRNILHLVLKGVACIKSIFAKKPDLTVVQDLPESEELCGCFFSFGRFWEEMYLADTANVVAQDQCMDNYGLASRTVE